MKWQVLFMILCGEGIFILQKILHRLCIHPQYRGCGKFLIKQAIEIAKFLNQKAIRLDVLCTNKPAIYLYEKCGFLLQGYQTMDYGEPVVAGLYERLI